MYNVYVEYAGGGGGGGGILSTVGMFSIVGNILSTVGDALGTAKDVQYPYISHDIPHGDEYATVLNISHGTEH